MTVEIFNALYFLFIFGGIIVFLVLFFILKDKSQRTKSIVVFLLLFLNLCLHFLKVYFPPYSTNPEKAARDIWFINICAVSVLTFPFFYLSKNKTLKDFMFYLGTLSGFLAFVYPTEAIGETIGFDMWRFYICHFIIIAGPLLMVVLKVHALDYKRIWKIPFVFGCVLLFIITQQVIQSEIGIVSLRNSDFFDTNYKNSSLIWGPGNEPLANVLKIFTPKIFTIVPFGEHVGEVKYWPFFWMMPSVFVYFTVLPLLLALPWEGKHIKKDIKSLFIKENSFVLNFLKREN